MNYLSFITLMASQGEQQSPYQMFIMMGLIVVVFYFFMIRPQVRKQKEIKKFREELAKGDKVLTVGGIYGKVLEINEDNIVIEVEGQSKLRVAKAGIIKDTTAMMGQK